jgi:putative sterol carrier protein
MSRRNLCCVCSLLSHFAYLIETFYSDDVVESLKIQLQHAKRENEKKDVMIQDLLKKIHDALDTIKVQAHQIKGEKIFIVEIHQMNNKNSELQAKLTGELKDDGSMFKVPLVRVPMPVRY